MIALTFLTRIPICNRSIYQQEDFQKSIFFFPIIGLLIGGILWGSYYLLDMIFPQQITAALLLFIYVVLTGGLHLDGLIDTVDGLYGGMTKERRLEIMKDTNPGAFGVLGAVLILVLKYSIYAQIDQGMLLFLVVAPVLGRQSMVWVQVFYPYARKEGLGKLFSVYHNFMLTQDSSGFLQCGPLRGCDQILLGHYFSDRALQIVFKTEITIGDNPHQLSIYSDGYAGDMVMLHQLQCVTE
jgi:adenosylcobinamide-GDP ribazoletransferase